MNDINNQNIKKSINFDLDTNKLKEIYPNKNYTQAYDDIKRFLIKNGFEHTQGSGYISKKELVDAQITRILKKMSKKFDWFVDCCKVLHSSDVKPVYDGLLIMKANKNSSTLDKIKLNEHKKSFKLTGKYNKSKDKDLDIKR